MTDQFSTMDALSFGNPYTTLSALTAAVGSFVAGIVSLVLSPVAVAANAIGNIEDANVLAGFSAIFGGMSLGLAAVALHFSPQASPRVLGGSGLGISAIAIFGGIYEVVK